LIEHGLCRQQPRMRITNIGLRTTRRKIPSLFALLLLR
jgi:hypothetical protein